MESIDITSLIMDDNMWDNVCSIEPVRPNSDNNEKESQEDDGK